MPTKIAEIRLQSTIDERCKVCFLKTYQLLMDEFNADSKQQEHFMNFYQDAMIRHNMLSTPEITRELNNTFCKIIGVSDLFAKEKESSNRIALQLYKEWKPKVTASGNPFNLALRLAIAGNIMDYGANNSFDVHQTIDLVMNTNFAIDNSVLLQQKIREAKSVLYIGDNAGEIVFDKLFIETLNHKQLTYAVRGAPVLNDATLSDATEIGIETVAKVISNGYDAPSTVLEKCSKEFREVYNSSDLIIAKGQGNLEGLITEHDPRIFFLLMVKCDVIGEILNVKKGSYVVFNQSI